MMPTGILRELRKSIVAGFQSLFFWMMPTGGVLQFAELIGYKVSILVLLDDAYRRLRFFFFPFGNFRFNPCSSG